MLVLYQSFATLHVDVIVRVNIEIMYAEVYVLSIKHIKFILLELATIIDYVIRHEFYALYTPLYAPLELLFYGVEALLAFFIYLL